MEKGIRFTVRQSHIWYQDINTDRWLSHLSMFQGVKSGVVGRADDFSVALVGGRSQSRCHVVARQTLSVTYGIVLPGVKCHTIKGALQNPVT